MTAATHVALIRGINVGGNNKVPMAALREALAKDGFDDVRTYIQSGNVLLAAPGAETADVTARVEKVLAKAFDVHTVVVTVTAQIMRLAVSGAPAGFGADTDTFKHDVVFLRPRLSVADAMAAVATREGVDQAWAGDGVLYFRRLSALVTKSYMSKVVARPEYKDMTIRNWRTATTVAGMLDG